MLKLSGALAAALLATSAVAQSTCPTPNRCGAYATTYCSRYLSISNTATTITATETTTETASETSTTTTLTTTVATTTETETSVLAPDTTTETETSTSTETTTTTIDVGTITSSAACTAGGGTLATPGPIAEKRQEVSIEAIVYTNVPPCFRGVRRSQTTRISSRCSCLSLMPTTTTVDGGTTTTTETTTTTILTDTTESVTATETTTETIGGGTITITQTDTSTTTTTATETSASLTVYAPPATFVIMGANPQQTNLPNQPSPANGLYGVLSQDGDAQPIDFIGATSALGSQFTLNDAGNLVYVGGSLVTPTQEVAYLSDVDAENPYLITYGTDANTTIPVLCRTFVAVDGTCPLRCRSGPVYTARRQKTCGSTNSYYVGRGADNMAGDETCARFRPMVMPVLQL